MKALKKITLSCLVVFGLATTASATTPTIGGTDAESISKKIGAAISLPKELRTPGFSQKVKIFFTVDEKGNVNHEAAVTKNTELKKAIDTQFKQLSFAELAPNTAYNIVINFIVQ